MHLSRNDEDQKRAYAAAEAGRPGLLLPPHAGQRATGRSARRRRPRTPRSTSWARARSKTRPVPGSTASYAIELIPANGTTACNPANAAGTMIVASGPQSGTFSIRSTGFSNGVKRRIVATFRRRSFLDYLYFTDFETSDPPGTRCSAGGNPTRSGTCTVAATRSRRPQLRTC